MNNNTLKCLFCGGDLIWDSDANLEDVYDEAQDDDGGVINCYTCSHCGRSYEIYDPIKQERETIYKEYWLNS